MLNIAKGNMNMVVSSVELIEKQKRNIYLQDGRNCIPC